MSAAITARVAEWLEACGRVTPAPRYRGDEWDSLELIVRVSPARTVLVANITVYDGGDAGLLVMPGVDVLRSARARRALEWLVARLQEAGAELSYGPLGTLLWARLERGAMMRALDAAVPRDPYPWVDPVDGNRYATRHGFSTRAGALGPVLERLEFRPRRPGEAL